MAMVWWTVAMLVAMVVISWVIPHFSYRRQEQLLRDAFREQASDIREMYIPLLEHQAQRDPEIAESCELMVAELRQRERKLMLVAQGKVWAVLRQHREDERGAR